MNGKALKMKGWMEKQFVTAKHLRCLYISPIQVEDILCEAVVQWARRAVYFTIRHEKDEKGCAMMQFVTGKECEEAKKVLTESLKDGVLVTHPTKETEDEMKQATGYRGEYTDLASRSLVVEDTTPDTTENQIALLFPDAISVSKLDVNEPASEWQNITNVFLVEFRNPKFVTKALSQEHEIYGQTVKTVHMMQYEQNDSGYYCTEEKDHGHATTVDIEIQGEEELEDFEIPEAETDMQGNTEMLKANCGTRDENDCDNLSEDDSESAEQVLSSVLTEKEISEEVEDNGKEKYSENNTADIQKTDREVEPDSHKERSDKKIPALLDLDLFLESQEPTNTATEKSGVAKTTKSLQERTGDFLPQLTKRKGLLGDAPPGVLSRAEMSAARLNSHIRSLFGVTGVYPVRRQSQERGFDIGVGAKRSRLDDGNHESHIHSCHCHRVTDNMTSSSSLSLPLVQTLKGTYHVICSQLDDMPHLQCFRLAEHSTSKATTTHPVDRPHKTILASTPPNTAHTPSYGSRHSSSASYSHYSVLCSNSGHPSSTQGQRSPVLHTGHGYSQRHLSNHGSSYSSKSSQRPNRTSLLDTPRKY